MLNRLMLETLLFQTQNIQRINCMIIYTKPIMIAKIASIILANAHFKGGSISSTASLFFNKRVDY